MNHGYEIECKNGAEVLNRMKFLFSKGFVFCVERNRDINKIKETFYDWNGWRYIWVGHNRECKKVMNTGNLHKREWGGIPVNPIKWKEFKKLLKA
jgi:hypothetical protein